MCYLSNEANDELETKKIFRIVDDAKKAGFLIYQVTGGEPLLREDLPKILKYAKSKGLKTYINTNGTLLNEICEDIFTYIDHISVSIDGSEDTHNKIRGFDFAFRKTIEGIEKAKKFGTNLRTIATIGKDNLHEMEEIAKISKKLEIPLLFQIRYIKKNLNNLMEIELGDVELKEFIKKIYFLKKKGYNINNSTKGINYLRIYNIACNYPKIFLLVGPSGRIFSCLNTTFGNVRTTSFKHIFHSEEYRQLVKRAETCNESCKLGCVSETNSLYNLNPSKIVSFLSRGCI